MQMCKQQYEHFEAGKVLFAGFVVFDLRSLYPIIVKAEWCVVERGAVCRAPRGEGSLGG